MPEANIEITAREMGWRPKEEFRGDPDKWVDANTFTSRAEHVLPIIKKDRDTARLRADELSRELTSTKEALREASEAITELRNFHGEQTAAAVAAARKSLIAELAKAREDGNVAAEVEIQDKIDELRRAKAEAPSKAPAPPAAPAPAPAAKPEENPDFVAWQADNSWFTEKPRYRSLAIGIAEELRREHPNLTGRAFFDRVSDEMKPYLAESAPPSKVEGGRPSGALSPSSGGSTRKRTFNDLPAEAKEACRQQAGRLVGANRAFKTAEEWQNHYAEVFFSEE